MQENPKNILITGGTSGLGLELVRLFLNKGFNVIATGRRLVSIPEFGDQFKFYQVDFNDLNLVSKTIKRICEIQIPEIVINNAGILSPPDYTTSKNNIELTLQVNFIAHLLINEIILRRITNDRPITIAAITSPVFKLAGSDLNLKINSRNYTPFKAYSSSKLCLIIMCQYLPERFSGLKLKCFSFDPGTFSSEIYRMQRKWFREMYHIASPFMRKPAGVAEKLKETLLKTNIENGNIYSLKKSYEKIPVIGEQQKKAFIEDCYNIIAQYL